MTGGSNNDGVLASSFRDPSGFLFFENDTLYRQVNKVYQQDYDLLTSSGLFQKLVDDGLLIPHQEVELERANSNDTYRIIQPDMVNYISYPYEWCFSQLKDAALTTLQIQKTALEFGMSLKDASAYNIQFIGSRPLLIDSLSFERYQEGKPWVAYRQFCQHFLAPLALMSCCDVRLNQLLQTNIDGIPLDMASCLLPKRSRLKFSLFTHIHLHARSQKRYANVASSQAESKGKTAKVSKLGFRALIESLESAVKKLHWKAADTEWGNYYAATNYADAAMEHKKKLVDEFVAVISPAPTRIQDLGANTGVFSQIAARHCDTVISQDIDPSAVEQNYRRCIDSDEKGILPLQLDLTTPSPGIGWANAERAAFMDRAAADTVMALALIHHLAISNNLPLPKIADFFRQLSAYLIIEFVPKSDSQVKRLLATREDIFPEYTQHGFEAAFTRCFAIVKQAQIEGSDRVLYLLRRSN
ncbi:MAG: hypothetical protein ACR2P1_08515 [Pseudomonadales bacterium]